MIKTQLSRDLNLNKLHNAYLVSTDDSEAALTEILAFLSESFYEHQNSLEHPDFILVKKLEGNVKNIAVEQIRSLQSFLNKTSIISGKKTAIIYDADQMNINASNSCLKILEDTPKNTHIFLLTSNPAALLPTIRSRCAKIKGNFHLNNGSTDRQIDDYYIKPFLKTTKIDEHLSYLKEFGSKDRDLWVKFTTNAQNLFARLIKKLSTQEVTLSPLETELLEQIMPTSPNHIIKTYNEVVKLTEETISFDLELRASYLLLVNFSL
jgi:DNA polymerase-3 subunit delta'